jgi:hypothetical protein
MAYDEGLAQRVRELFHETPGIEEKKMFGGLVFMVEGVRSSIRQSRSSGCGPEAAIERIFAGLSLTNFIRCCSISWESEMFAKKRSVFLAPPQERDGVM